MDRPGAVPQWSWQQVSVRRLARHGLSTPLPDASPADVARVICGAHAQIMSAAEVSIALRLRFSTRSTVKEAWYVHRTLVKTYGPRGTVHLLPTRDLPMWTAALSALPRTTSVPAQQRMTDQQTEHVIEAIADSLEGTELTMDELSTSVIARTGSWAGDLVMPAFQDMWPRWRQAIATAAHRGALVFGPPRGRQVTFTSPRRWWPDFHVGEPQDSLGALVRGYLDAYGPARSRDFAQWLGAAPRWAAERFAELEGALECVDVEGVTAWVTAGDADPPSGSLPGVRLLPYFDAYLVGCHPRDRLYPGRAGERALSATRQAGTYPVLLVDGLVAGVWHTRRSGQHVQVSVEPFGAVSTRQRRGLD
ncbi:MAG: hypothetical protein QOF35_508, partial [Actinomycetota bacterium]|nr:hypothetical protein [Actinomycetota bacterium]